MQLTFQNVLGQKGLLVTYYEKTTKHEYAKQQKDCKKHHLSKSLFKNAKLGPFFCPGGSLPPFLFLNILMRNSPARSRKKRKARRSSTASTSTKAFSNFLHFCVLIYNISYFPVFLCQYAKITNLGTRQSLVACLEPSVFWNVDQNHYKQQI